MEELLFVRLSMNSTLPAKKMNKMSCSLGPLCSAPPLSVFTALLGKGVVLLFILAAESRIRMNRHLSASQARCGISSVVETPFFWCVIVLCCHQQLIHSISVRRLSRRIALEGRDDFARIHKSDMSPSRRGEDTPVLDSEAVLDKDFIFNAP